jgi:GNAT superfamily N-acetyltransferase
MHRTTTDIDAYRPRRITIRPLTAADRRCLATQFAHLSERTRRLRYGGLATRLSERDLDQLTTIDHHDHEALAAIEPRGGAIVGVGRYIALPESPGTAEVAVEVADEWQGIGIGRRLITEVVRRARMDGIVRLVAYVSRDNLSVRSWIARAGGTVESDDGDATLFSIPLLDAHFERRAAG